MACGVVREVPEGGRGRGAVAGEESPALRWERVFQMEDLLREEMNTHYVHSTDH